MLSQVESDVAEMALQTTNLFSITTSNNKQDDNLPKSDQNNDHLIKKKQFSYFFWFTGIAIICSVLDLWTKQAVFGHLGMPGEKEMWWVWKDVFGFQTALNEGALFGMGQGFVIAFAVLSIVMLIGIVIWVLVPFSKNLFLIIIMGLVSGGIVGNLYDRLGFHQLRWNDSFHSPDSPVYAVRDWILVMIGSYHWPNFNLADSYLVCGVICLAIYTLFFTDKAVQK
ncbi:MAG: signal peptidase II [Planctomycetaceae bacterium]|jgi:signal peptidase II|nr:signal peptidase II [Planctomycetaceae bacterium]